MEYNVDINMQVEGLKNQTPLMVAVQQLKTRHYKLKTALKIGLQPYIAENAGKRVQQQIITSVVRV